MGCLAAALLGYARWGWDSADALHEAFLNKYSRVGAYQPVHGVEDGLGNRLEHHVALRGLEARGAVA